MDITTKERTAVNNDKKRKKKTNVNNKAGSLSSTTLSEPGLYSGHQLATEFSSDNFRLEALDLAKENEALQCRVLETEKATMDIIEFMKKNDEEKDRKVKNYQDQLDALTHKLAQKTKEIDFVKAELNLIKQYRHKEAEMQKELEETRNLKAAASREYKENLAVMEQKFADEKLKLEKQSNQKICKLASQAHDEVLANLSDTTKSVYKENVRLNKALHHYMDQAEQLNRLKCQLEKENYKLKTDQELGDSLIRRKVSQSRHDKSLIKELQERITALERTLKLVVEEFEEQEKLSVERTRKDLEQAASEIVRLQKTLQLKTKETSKIKKLARNIVDQRTDIERFFLDSLAMVRKEIEAERETLMVHRINRQSTSTSLKHGNFFRPKQFLDMSSKVDISDLTWEQKETVLRYLFVRMNKQASWRNRMKASVVPLLPGKMKQLVEKEAWSENGKTSEGQTFLTEGPDQEDGCCNLPSSLAVSA